MKKRKIEPKMKLPPNYSEQEFLQVIDNISQKLAKKFKFAYFEIDDIKQEIYYWAIRGLEGYDNVRPLENFLYRHVKNRLINLKRDRYQRPGEPCLKCPEHDPKGLVSLSQCKLFCDKNQCQIYQEWKDRNLAKKNIVSPIDITIINDENEQNTRAVDNLHHELNAAELLDKIDKELPLALREDYLKMRAGIKLSKIKRDMVQEAILEILG